MDRKAKIELIKVVKNHIGIVAAFFDDAGVRIVKQVCDEWLAAHARKAKAARARARRKKP